MPIHGVWKPTTSSRSSVICSDTIKSARSDDHPSKEKHPLARKGPKRARPPLADDGGGNRQKFGLLSSGILGLASFVCEEPRVVLASMIVDVAWLLSAGPGGVMGGS